MTDERPEVEDEDLPPESPKSDPVPDEDQLEDPEAEEKP